MPESSGGRNQRFEVGAEPTLRRETDDHLMSAVGGRHLHVLLAACATEVADGRLTHDGLRVHLVDPHRALDADVAEGRTLVLDTEAPASRFLKQRDLAARLRRHHDDVTAGLVPVPDRDGQGSTTFLGDAEHTDMSLGEEPLALEPTEGKRHRVNVLPGATYAGAARPGRARGQAGTYLSRRAGRAAGWTLASLDPGRADGTDGRWSGAGLALVNSGNPTARRSVAPVFRGRSHPGRLQGCERGGGKESPLSGLHAAESGRHHGQ